MKRITIAITGLPNAGKTSFTQRLLTGSYISFLPTLGVDVEFAKYKDYPLQIWDMGGQIAFRRHIWENYVKQSSAIIYVFDASDLSHLEEGVEWFWKVLSWTEKKDIPILFLANKRDLVQDRESIMEKVISSFRLNELGSSDSLRSFRFFFVSVKTGAYIDEAMNWLIIKQFVETKQIISEIVSFDMFIVGEDFYAHYHDNSDKRNQISELIENYKKKWIQSKKFPVTLVEEMIYGEYRVLYLSFPNKAIVLTTKTETDERSTLTNMLNNITVPLPLSDCNKAYELLDYTIEELNKVFLTYISASLSCDIIADELIKQM